MRILSTFYVPSGGMETLHRMRAGALKAHGIDMHLLYKMPAEGLDNIQKRFKTFVTDDDQAIRSILEQEQYDAIIVASDHPLLERLRAFGYTGRLIFEAQGLGTLETATEVVQAAAPVIRAQADALLLPRTDHLIELFKEHLPSMPLFAFDNVIDTEQFHYNSYPPRKYPIIGWVGRIEHNKNWSDFLEIGHLLIKWNPDIYLWLFEGLDMHHEEERKRFEATVDRLNLRDRLIRYSNVPHSLMADYYSIIGESNGFVCSTSIMEGFGYSVAEAMLCRCPVLATDSDGVRRFITHDKTGKFYPIYDTHEGAWQGVELMTNERLRKSIRLKGEKHITKNFSTAKYIGSFLSMLQALGLPAK